MDITMKSISLKTFCSHHNQRPHLLLKVATNFKLNKLSCTANSQGLKVVKNHDFDDFSVVSPSPEA